MIEIIQTARMIGILVKKEVIEVIMKVIIVLKIIKIKMIETQTGIIETMTKEEKHMKEDFIIEIIIQETKVLKVIQETEEIIIKQIIKKIINIMTIKEVIIMRKIHIMIMEMIGIIVVVGIRGEEENITKQFEEQGYKPPEPNQFEQEEKVQEDRGFQSGNFDINSEPQEFKTVSDRLKSTKRKNNAGNDKLKANKIIYTTNNMDDLSNYFFNIRNNNNYYGYGNNYGYGYGNNYGYKGYSNSYVFDLGGFGNNYYGYSIYNPYQQQQQQQKQEETPEMIKQKTQEAQKNWIYLYKKYVKDSGIFVLRTVGGVIKALTFLKNEEEGKNTGVSMNEKVRMYEILTENKHIINMLANAHKEALRRKEEQRQLEEDKEKLEELRREEERRQKEEKKR